MSASILVDNLLILALSKYPQLKEKWNNLLLSVCSQNGVPFLAMHCQADGRTDLILRVLEDEAAAAMPNHGGVWGQDMQRALTRYWILSSYELLRTLKESPIGKPNARSESLYQRFRLVRVPMTKLQIANDRALKQAITLERVGEGPPSDPIPYSASSKSEYFPPEIFNTLTGSIGWMTLDAANLQTHTLTRRQLSDEFLGLLEQRPVSTI
jgi:hypothetical protein